MSVILAMALWFQTPKQNEATEAFREGYAAAQRGDLIRAQADFAQVVRLMPNVAAGHTAYGKVLLAQDNLAAALTELQTAHRIDPSDAIAIGGLAEIYSRQGHFKDSVSLWMTLPTGIQLPAHTSIAFATAFTETGHPVNAAGLLKEALVKEPSNPLLHDALGSVLAQQQMFEPARAEFQQAIALDSNAALPHFHLGSLNLLEQNPTSAIDELSLAKTIDPNNLETQLQLGRAEIQAHRDDAALATFQNAFKLSPQSPDAQYALALVLQNVGKVQESLPLFEKAASARPNDPQILSNYALDLVQSGDTKSAFPLYERALELQPKNPILHEDIGVAYLQSGDFDHSIEEFRKGVALVSDDRTLGSALHYDLGLALKLKDRLSEAITELQQAELLDPSQPDPPYTLGVSYMQSGDFSKSATELERATSLRPDNGEAWALLGSVYQQMEQPALAIAALRQAIKLQPEQPGSHVVLAGILARQGDRDGAASERKKAADLSRAAVGRQHTDFVLRTAMSLLQNGNFDDAAMRLQNAITEDPNNAALHRLLAETLARQGKGAEAAVERRKAAEVESAPH